MEHIYGHVNDEIPMSMLYPSKKFNISEKYVKKYKNAIHPADTFHIFSFEQIGIFDPFPMEPMETKFKIPVNDDDLIYHEERYFRKYSPTVAYFPSNLMLFKIMRACIDITRPEDLWFNSYKHITHCLNNH